MRVHASDRDNVRLWASAAAGAVVLFTVIVLLGAGPTQFPSLLPGGTHATPAVVLPPVAEARGDASHRGPQTARPGHARAATHPHRSLPATGTSRRNGKPEAHPSRRPAPPVANSQRPGPASKPAAPAATPPAPLVPLPPPVEIAPILPTLPTVDVPPLPDPTGSLPPLPALPLP